jgi:hypothetical protein
VFFDLSVLNWNNDKLLVLYECIIKNIDNDCHVISQFVKNLLNIINIDSCENRYKFYFSCWCINYRCSFFSINKSENLIKTVITILKEEIGKSCREQLCSLETDKTILDVVRKSINKQNDNCIQSIHMMIKYCLTDNEWNNVILKIITKSCIEQQNYNINHYLELYIYI